VPTINDLKGDDDVLFIWGAEDGDGEPDAGDGDGEPDADKDEDGDNEPEAKKTPAKKVAVKDDKDDSDDDDDEDEDDPQKEIARLKRENIKLKKAEQAKKDAEDADADLAKKYTKATKTNAKLTSFIDTHLINAAIINQSAGKYDWIDRDDVNAAIDRDAININLDTGEIEGLDVELKRISKKKPHWLKTSDEEPAANGARGSRGIPARTPGTPAVTGGHPFGSVPKGRVTDDDKLRAKYKIGGPLRSVNG